jgi:phosphocarrier protein
MCENYARAKEFLMATRTVAIASAIGLHARPASLFVQAASATGIPIKVGRPGQPGVDARSILLVMALGVKHNEEVELSAEGEGADAALDSLVELLSRDLDAE